MTKITKAFLNDVDTLDEYKENKCCIEKEIAALKERIAAVRTAQNESLHQAIFSAEMSSVPELLRNDSRTTADKRKAFQAVAEKVIYNKSKNSLELFLIDK